MLGQISVRLSGIAVTLVLATAWALGSAASAPSDYPNSDLLVSADWLGSHANDPGLVIVDVRNDEHYHGECIEGAIRMPWGQFRETDPLVGAAGVFVGVGRAQELLGEHGIQRSDTVVLYDSIERDGGATASYVFWVLEHLGHTSVKLLDGGVDAWKQAGLDTATEPAKLGPVLYQAAPEELRPEVRIRGAQLQERLGDRYWQILDVRSRDEYLGEAPNADWQGRALKLGHIPGAYNVNYQDSWVDKATKLIKPYAQVQQRYAGLDPAKAVVTYCHSGRRSSHTYFVLRLMGFSDVRLYDYSWNEWGKKSLYFPVQTKENILTGPPPGALSLATERTEERRQRPTGDSGAAARKSGYISCGG